MYGHSPFFLKALHGFLRGVFANIRGHSLCFVPERPLNLLVEAQPGKTGGADIGAPSFHPPAWVKRYATFMVERQTDQLILGRFRAANQARSNRRFSFPIGQLHPLPESPPSPVGGRHPPLWEAPLPLDRPLPLMLPQSHPEGRRPVACPGVRRGKAAVKPSRPAVLLRTARCNCLRWRRHARAYPRR